MTNDTIEKEAKRPQGRPPKHGAYGGSMLIPLTHEKVAMVTGLMKGTLTLVGPADKIAVELLGRNLAKIELIDRYLQVHGLFDDDGKNPQPVLRLYWLAMNSAARLCDQLGLTPQSRVRLGMGVAGMKDDMAAEMAKQRGE